MRQSENLVCAIIVTYNPNSDVYSNVDKVVRQCHQVIVVDNGSEDANFLTELESTSEKIITIPLSFNSGIAHALNVGLANAERKCRWILLLDQDTCLQDNYISQILEQAKHYFGLEMDQYLLSPNFSGLKLQKEIKSAGYSVIDFAITSGSIISKNVFTRVGGMDDSLFIDYVDNDFCFRAELYGIKTVRLNGIFLEHSLGNMQPIKIFGIKLHTSNHSAIRKYYISRNRIIVYRRFGLRKILWMCRDIIRIPSELIKILMAEDNKMEKTYHIAKGIWSGLKGGSGPYDAT